MTTLRDGFEQSKAEGVMINHWSAFQLGALWTCVMIGEAVQALEGLSDRDKLSAVLSVIHDVDTETDSPGICHCSVVQ